MRRTSLSLSLLRRQVLLLLLAAAALLAGQQASAQLQFTQLTPVNTPPAVRSQAGIAFSGTTLFLFGGVGAAYFSDTWTFDVTTNQWTEQAPAASPPARSSMIAGVHSSGFIIAMGQGAGGFFNDVWRYTLGGTWVQLGTSSSSRPRTRYGAAGGIFGLSSTYLYVSHGFSKKRYSDTWRFNIAGEQWENVVSGVSLYRPGEAHARCLVGSAMVADEDFVMFGGCMSGGESGGNCPAFDGWFWRSGGWHQLESGPAPRQYSGMAFAGTNRAFLYGGQEKVKQILHLSDSSGPDEVQVLTYTASDSAGSWDRQRCAGAPTVARAKHAMTHFQQGAQEGAILFGGETIGSAQLLNDVWTITGSASEAAHIGGEQRWLSTVVLHAIFMFLGWGVFLQIGVFVARNFRHRNPWWFRVHRTMQVVGLVFALIGFAFALRSVQSKHFSFAHGAIGLVIMLLGLLQPLNAYFRPHPPPAGSPPTRARFWWSILHRSSGYIAIILAMINISLGLFLAVAPRGVWGTWFAYYAVWIVVWAAAEIRLYRNGANSGSNTKNSSSMDMDLVKKEQSV